jgi:16S rRNA processing protein RimM
VTGRGKFPQKDRRPSNRTGGFSVSERPARAIDPADLILVGITSGAFGVQGEVKVRSFTADPADLFAYGPLYGQNGAIVLTYKSHRRINDGFAVRASEIATREDAMQLRNVKLHIPRSILPDTDEDEFYHIDLIGCTVETMAGEAIGKVVAVPDFGAGELLEIKPQSGPTFYVPFTKAIVPIIDIAEKRIIADPPVIETGEPTET